MIMIMPKRLGITVRLLFINSGELINQMDEWMNGWMNGISLESR